MNEHVPPPAAIEEARRTPNGWVYKIDAAYDVSGDIPPEAIVGAWKVDENGEISGEFLENPNYIPLDEKTTD